MANNTTTPPENSVDHPDLYNIESEYRELNNHIRECWKYISELLKNFIFMQIILISILFLSGSVIKYGNMSIPISANPNQQELHSPDISKREFNFRKVALLPLVLIGLVSPLGAVIQNKRLFTNAKKFVRRAAYIELIGGFPEDDRTDNIEKTYPANTYMNKELYNDERYNLRSMLSIVYWAFFGLWILYIATQFIFLINVYTS